MHTFYLVSSSQQMEANSHSPSTVSVGIRMCLSTHLSHITVHTHDATIVLGNALMLRHVAATEQYFGDGSRGESCVPLRCAAAVSHASRHVCSVTFRPVFHLKWCIVDIHAVVSSWCSRLFHRADASRYWTVSPKL